jgi:hypothetical protein
MQPELKQECDLTQADFEREPVWVGVHNHDPKDDPVNAPWYKDADEQTYRPWKGALPFNETRGWARVAATIVLADGTAYPGSVRTVGDDWDQVIPGRRLRDGSFTKPLQWSARRGGSPLSVLLLQNPVLFVGTEVLDFRMGKDFVGDPARSFRRQERILRFYRVLAKLPHQVFPVRFSANAGLATGVVDGRLDGFVSSELDKPLEMSTGASYLGALNEL